MLFCGMRACVCGLDRSGGSQLRMGALSPAAVLALLSNDMHGCSAATSCQVVSGTADELGA